MATKAGQGRRSAAAAPRQEGGGGGPQRLGKTLTFMQLLWAVSHQLHSMSKRTEAALGVTGPQRLALRVIGRNPGISAGQLAEVLRLHPSTLTGILRRLEDRELIQREIDPRDGRRSNFALTSTGRHLDALQAPTGEAALRRALRRLDDTRVSAAKEVLAVVVNELEH
jgi:DNA-binding MarR family transcriptional regulator